MIALGVPTTQPTWKSFSFHAAASLKQKNNHLAFFVEKADNSNGLYLSFSKFRSRALLENLLLLVLLLCFL